MGIHPGELGTQQEDLRRVVHPHQHHHQRAGCPEAGADGRQPEVGAQQVPAHGKQPGRDQRAHPHIRPRDAHPRHQLVDQREDQGDQGEAAGRVQHRQHQGPALELRCPPALQAGQRRTGHQRHHQQEAQPQDQAERQHPGAQQQPQPAGGAGGRTPDAVQRVLQFGEHGGGAQQHQHQAQRGGGPTAGGAVHAFQQALNGCGARGADQSLQLAEDLATRGLGAEHQAGHRRHDQQQRRQREQRVVGQRRALAGRVVVDPGGDRPTHQHPGQRPGRGAGGAIGQRRLSD